MALSLARPIVAIRGSVVAFRGFLAGRSAAG